MVELIAVVQAISSRIQRSSLIDLLVDDIRVSLRGFVDSQVCYVRRTANVATHCMAKLAVSSSIKEPTDLIVETLFNVV
ncbi:hypothetical protein ACFXTN_010726 [Malus domestica]